MQSVLVAEAAGEIHFRTILLWHSQGRRKGDAKHKCCGKNQENVIRGLLFNRGAGQLSFVLHGVVQRDQADKRNTAPWRDGVTGPLR